MIDFTQNAADDLDFVQQRLEARPIEEDRPLIEFFLRHEKA